MYDVLSDSAVCCIVWISDYTLRYVYDVLSDSAVCSVIDMCNAMENIEIVTSYEDLVRQHIVSSYLLAVLCQLSWI